MAKQLPSAFLANQKKKGSAAPTTKTHAGKGKTVKAMPGRKGSSGGSRGSSGSGY